MYEVGKKTLAEDVQKDLDKAISSLRDAIGNEYVFQDVPNRAIRSAVPAPFPLHDWEAHIPDVVVMPSTTEEVVEIVKIANEYKIPIVPRAGATGLADGAVPLKKGILLDVKRMNQIIEIDDINMTATVQPGVSMLELNKVLTRVGLFYPDDPASYPCAIIGGRIGSNGFSLIGGGYGHVPNLVISQEIVLPTGKVIRVGGGGGRKIRKSSVGYNIKDLFIGHQGTLGITTEATLDICKKPEAECPAFFGTNSFEESHKLAFDLEMLGLRSMAAVLIFDPQKIEFLRRDDEAYIPQPKEIRSVVLALMYGTEAEVTVARDKVFETAVDKHKAIYLGDEISKGDWASRHDRYHIAYHGRNKAGEVSMMTWHCEDAAINHSELPQVRKKWHAIVEQFKSKYDGIFDDWGMFMYTNNPFRPYGDYLTEIDIGVNELEMTPEIWNAFVDMKRQIAEVALEAGGSISACHGGTRMGDVEVACYQELAEGTYDLMKEIKKMLDPNNIMNPGKYLLDSAYNK
ncbi:FAD-binding oxidoreductase [Desulforhopalus singaporensis]|uniref:D-lactate dehydrogenase (cytochrome) n=1 Tax=Desulforhopalus singaporensis TaxID=91360 RepID=A0A1H0VDH5_9BACT|nr:FAD-binding oxidoreductase [Desulforhopalus singaporensis]SDP76391.1 glycolate oxidase [Desulforhopalus singaporensis]